MFPLLSFGQKGDLLFDNTFLHDIRIVLPEGAYQDSLASNYETYSQFSGSDIPYLMGSISIDGNMLDSVGVRYKGKSSYYYVNEKKPIKIDLNEYLEDQTFDGLKKFNLHNSIGDPGMLRDLLCYDMMREAGVAAPRISFARVFINNDYWGLFKIVEQIDKTFLDNNFANGKGNLYKNQRWSNLEWQGDDPITYKDTFELKTNVAEDDWTGFIHFLDVLNNSSDESFPDAIQKIFNVDRYLHVLAIDIMSNNWDSYIDNRRNWYLYQEPESGQFNWIPWDYNLALGGRLTTDGNPYPPFDDNCLLQTTFNFSTDGATVQFNEFSEPSAQNWLWDFGDGTFSTQQHPTHTFNTTQKVKVCLTSRRPNGGQTCEQTRCKVLDLSFDPADCHSVQNGTSPYPGNDPIFQRVIAEDEHCCSSDWDVFCEISYQEFSNNPEHLITSGIDYDTDYPLLHDDPEKVLIRRLLAVPEFKDRYLAICCLIRQNVFQAEKLFSKIDFYSGLLRESVYSDPYYNYTVDYFEYDVGNGSGGGSEARIPSLKYFFNQRIPQIDTDLDQAQQDCGTVQSPISWRQIVINEFVSSNDMEGGIADEEGDYDDWIELYNTTNSTISLAGFYLSDDASQPKLWAFPPDTEIAPNGYLIIWADKDPAGLGLHADFKLAKTGEEILLSHEDETLIDQVSFGEQITNIASARIPNGTGPFVQQSPTFNKNNDAALATSTPDQNHELLIFPNPIKSQFQIVLPNYHPKNPIQLQVTNSLGTILFTQILAPANQWQLDISSQKWITGIHFLKLQIDGQLLIKKIVVQ